METVLSSVSLCFYQGVSGDNAREQNLGHQKVLPHLPEQNSGYQDLTLGSGAWVIRKTDPQKGKALSLRLPFREWHSGHQQTPPPEREFKSPQTPTTTAARSTA
ncbi:rho guanine nucleotide exchange factor 18 [Platysternon megacephalum]|uniref:Rho guanine nucleotide exchange factor 18 n=1 Tax=Platysternon megacephalum TaxID=55544 RepID=A0A4D9EHN8_9SAUR|nr:rho guanine nucleotide exchange factor 18 [Platysternon megacephalum]